MARVLREWGPIFGVRRNWLSLTVLWEPRDLWIGVYVAKASRDLHDQTGGVVRLESRDVFICPLPTLVLRVTVFRSLPDTRPYFDLPTTRHIEMGLPEVADGEEWGFVESPFSESEITMHKRDEVPTIEQAYGAVGRVGGVYVDADGNPVHWSGPRVLIDP